MPKAAKYPRFRSYIRKNKNAGVRVYYFYDMRSVGRKDVPLGTDHACALKRWDELHNHKPRASGRVQEAIDQWREQVLPNYVEETRKGYGRQLANIEGVFGGMLWDDIDLPMLREYLKRRMSKKKVAGKAKPVIAKTQGNRDMAVFSIVWNYAKLNGMTKAMWPATGNKSWKNEESPRTFEVTDDLFHAVYKQADQLLRDCMDIATSTGMRLTDARTVRMPVDGKLRFRANKSAKWAYFEVAQSPVLTELLERRGSVDCVMLLTTPTGRQVSLDMLQTRFDAAREKAALANPNLADSIRAMYLRDMRKRAAELNITGVAVVAYFDGDSIRSWTSRMAVVGSPRMAALSRLC